MSSMSTAACLQEALAQAGVSLGLKEALCSDSGQRETRKSGLSKDKWSVCDVLTLSELSRVEWNVLCRQSSYSEESGHQEIGKKKTPAQRKPLGGRGGQQVPACQPQ